MPFSVGISLFSSLLSKWKTIGVFLLIAYSAYSLYSTFTRKVEEKTVEQLEKAFSELDKKVTEKLSSIEKESKEQAKLIKQSLSKNDKDLNSKLSEFKLNNKPVTIVKEGICSFTPEYNDNVRSLIAIANKNISGEQ